MFSSFQSTVLKAQYKSALSKIFSPVRLTFMQKADVHLWFAAFQ